MATAVLADKGITVSEAIRCFMTRVAEEKALPFHPLLPNEATLAAIREARRGGGKRYLNLQDLMADLGEDA